MKQTLVVGVVGLLVGGVVSAGGVILLSDGPETTTDDSSIQTQNVSLSVGTSGPTCLDAPNETGWVHLVADGESFDVTFDLAVAGANPSVSLERTGPATYTLAVTASEWDTGGDCRSVRRVTGGGSVPSSFETLRVTVDGAQIAVFDDDTTMPRLQPVPTPLSARNTTA